MLFDSLWKGLEEGVVGESWMRGEGRRVIMICEVNSVFGLE